MKTILFLNNRYIDTLDGLRSLFKGVINDDLRRELLASFRDGIIDNWLSEGDEECHRMLNELSKVDKSGSNRAIERMLTSIFAANSSINSFAGHVVTFEDHCMIQDISYCKVGKDGNLFGNPEPATALGIKFKKNEYVGFQLYVAIKITNPDNEIMPIQFELSDLRGNVFDKTLSLSLNTKKNDVTHLTLDVKLGELRHNMCKIQLKVNDDVFWTSPLLIGTSFVTLHLDEIHIPLSLVEGQGGLSSFYMMRYQATEEFRFNSTPIVNVSWKEVMKIVKDLNQKYHTRFRLPSVEEWQFAAKGGLYNNAFKYAGSDDVEEVAWCNHSIQNVGLKQANKLGLFDMSGNVWEMTSDIRGSYRLTCGGSCYSSAEECKIDSLSQIGSSYDYSYDCGFRLVCDITSIHTLPKECVEYEQECEATNHDGDFIDMGGSVLWSIEDYTNPKILRYIDAKFYANERGDNSRLPSADEFEELFANSICEIRNGFYQLKSKINGEILKIPYKEGCYWTETEDPTTWGNKYHWFVYASIGDQKCYNYTTGPCHNTGRTDIARLNVIAVIKK